jgi:hypothetical protein
MSRSTRPQLLTLVPVAALAVVIAGIHYQPWLPHTQAQAAPVYVSPSTPVHLDLPGADPLASIFVLTEDKGNMPPQVGYDADLAISQVYQVFGPSQQTRALIVSRPLLDAVTHPQAGWDQPGGTPEYYALITVIYNSHVLVALDASSSLIGSKLGLGTGPTPFDPWRRRMILVPDDPAVLLAATIVRFTPETSFTQERVEAANEPGAGWLGGGAVPPYEMIDTQLRRFLEVSPTP